MKLLQTDILNAIAHQLTLVFWLAIPVLGFCAWWGVPYLSARKKRH